MHSTPPHQEIMKQIKRLIIIPALLSMGAIASAQTFSDSSFENFSIPFGGWVQSPASPVWNFTGGPESGSGVAHGPGSWGQGANSGGKYSYIQRTSTISQTVGGFTVGQQYQLRFSMTRRNGNLGADSPNRIGVELNGTTLNTIDTIDDTRWRQYETPVFTASNTSMTFSWRGLLNDDRASLLDDALLVTPTNRTGFLTDGGFETINFEPGRWAYNPQWLVGSEWRYGIFGSDRAAGIASAGSPWGGSAASGTHFGFVQRDGQLIQQMSNLVVGYTYRVRFAHRSRFSAPHQIRVFADSTQILGPTGSTGSWLTRTTGSFVATSSSMSLMFTGVSTPNDLTSLIDSVEVVPEPATLTVIGLGMAAMLRRRRAR